MKNPNRSLVAVTIFSLGCLWAGYAIGYHHGLRDERQQWWSSAQEDSQGHLVFTGLRPQAWFDTRFVHGNGNPIPEKLRKR